MKRRILSLILALVLALGLSTTAGAYTSKQLRAADALYHLDLFRGTSTTAKVYELDKGFKRFEGTILLLRMIGEESKAEATDPAENPFADVTDWTTPYLTYAWKTGLVNGRSVTAFDPTGEMNDSMFLTLVLRVLGYKDGNEMGAGVDFLWSEPYTLAKQVGLISTTAPDEDFTRGDAVLIFWNAMGAKFKGTNKTLSGSLMDAKVFTAAKYAEAKEIWTYGELQDDDSGYTPSVPSTPTTPTNPDSGEDNTGTPDEGEMTYEKYINLSGAQQQAFMEANFGLDAAGMAAFFQWYNAAKAEYEANRETIEIGGDGTIDLGDIISGGN